MRLPAGRVRRHRRNKLGALPLPFWGEGWGEGVRGLSIDRTPSPHPSPYGRGSRPSSPHRQWPTSVFASEPLSRRAASLRLDRLDAHQVPDLVDLLDERLGLEDLGIVLVELGVDDRLDAAGTRRHDRDAVGEIDRLLHVVGYEDHG